MVKPLLPLFLLAVLFLYEEWVSTPSCELVPSKDAVSDSQHDGDDLKVMIVADLLLLGSADAGFFNLYFRDYYMSKFFTKSFHRLKPDMLLVLGDVSAGGSELSKVKWVSVLNQFHRVLGPFLDLPFHVVLGDNELGDCNGLDYKSVRWIARTFPGLDSAGCGAFQIANVSFVSLNSVALLCGKNKLRFSVEKMVETESVELQMEAAEDASKVANDSGEVRAVLDGFGWRENATLAGSGAVLLLHLPLHRTGEKSCVEANIFKKAPNPLRRVSSVLGGRGFTVAGPYDVSDTVPLNATEYLFQALKPRIIFSAHSQEFCDHQHSDGTREITVPSMSWKARDDPGFIFASFGSHRNTNLGAVLKLESIFHAFVYSAAIGCISFAGKFILQSDTVT